ncbi:hypothetical protein [Hyphomicrobium sp.]|uniref:hypothetical protein n=1 Tax=Hyphomicrobium sp. TaxID=82 RepID=UPI002E352D04|nr:hypothetical protein [Hyphomicrobium sp.]HEX2841733.1 hypothetical protein [Hyphomicrobium sp.]
MTTKWAARAATLTLGLTLTTAFGMPAHAERWPGTTASIGGAIAARIIAVKCSGPLTPAEISELDTYIDERQTAFMTGSKANQRYGERVFPLLARDYDKNYSSPEACDSAARDMAKDMLDRVRQAQAVFKKQAELQQQ